MAIIARTANHPNPFPNPGVANLNRMFVGFVDVGQGDCTFFHLPDGRRLMIDCGSTFDGTDNSIGGQLPYHNGSLGLDVLVMSHSDADHYNRLGPILGGDAITTTYYSNVTSAYSNNEFRQWFWGQGKYNPKPKKKIKSDRLAAMPKLGKLNSTLTPISVNVATPAIQSIMAHASYSVDVIAANVAVTTHVNDQPWITNTLSIVTRVRFGNDVVLVMADATCDTEGFILGNGGPGVSTVYRVGHHGSSTSSSTNFLNAAIGAVNGNSGATAVLSVGASNNFSHPRQSVCDRVLARLAGGHASTNLDWYTDSAAIECDGNSNVVAHATTTIQKLLHSTWSNSSGSNGLWLTMDGT